MDCNRFVEEKVAGDETPDFREHLASCEGCRRDLEELEEVRELYREASTERYAGGATRAARVPRGTWWFTAAAAAAMIAALVVTLGMPPGEDGGKVGPVPVTAGFSRAYLEPWDRQEARIAESMNELWRRVEVLERSVR